MYGVISRRVKFAGAGTNSIAALKKIFLPAMTSTIEKAKCKGQRDAQATYVANICAPRTPMVSGRQQYLQHRSGKLHSI